MSEEQTSGPLWDQLEADAEATGEPSKSELDQIAQLADQQIEAEEEVAKLERQLKEAKERARKISEEDLPTAMDEVGGGVGIKEFQLSNGYKIKVKEDVHASIPAKRKPEAFQWLRDHGHDAIIKNEVKATFNRGEDETAQELKDFLKSRGYSAEQVENVHAQTLKKWVKDMEAEGHEVPEDLFGVYHRRQSIVEKG